MCVYSSLGKESTCKAGGTDVKFDTWVGKVPWRSKRPPTPAFIAENSHGQRSLVDYSPKGRKESDITEQLSNSMCIYTHICKSYVREFYILYLHTSHIIHFV